MNSMSLFRVSRNVSLSRRIPVPFTKQFSNAVQHKFDYTKEDSVPNAQELYDSLAKLAENKYNAISSGRIRHILQACYKPEHATLAVESVRIYQNHHNDFSSELTSQFIKACVRCGSPKSAADEISVYANRVGAWVSPKAFNLLVASRSDCTPEMLKNDLPWLLSAAEMAVKKGLHPHAHTIKNLFSYVDKIPPELDLDGPVKATMHKRITAIAASRLNEKELATLKAAFPAPPQRPLKET